MSSPSLDVILPLLRDLAGIQKPGLSNASDAAVRLCDVVKTVRSEETLFMQLATNACELLYVVAYELKEKGQKNIDDAKKRDLDDLASVLEKIIIVAQTNANRNPFSSFWCSDVDSLKDLQDQLEKRLSLFSIESFNDLQRKANERIPQLQGGNTTNVNNSGTFSNCNLSHITQRDNGTVNQVTNYKNEMFRNASGFNIHGGEFNNIGRNMNKTTYHGFR